VVVVVREPGADERRVAATWLTDWLAEEPVQL